jgi:predicted deacylase
VHGDEFEPVLAALELIKTIENMLETGEVVIIPVANTSAYLQGSRYGADGLDLARTFPGNSSGSVTQQCAASVSEMIKTADYLIDMHTGGRLYDIYPLAGYTLHDSPGILEKQRKMAEAFNLPVIWGTDNSLPGRTLSVARDAGVPAIYVEYGGGGEVNATIIRAYVRGCMGVLAALNMIADNNKVIPLKKYRVEDYTPDSGHLQSKLPAPKDGIFMPAVRVGEKISTGQLWGTITDPLNGASQEVRAGAEGLVLFLRVCARVNTGDSLGGILPVAEQEKLVTIYPPKKGSHGK